MENCGRHCGKFPHTLLAFRVFTFALQAWHAICRVPRERGKLAGKQPHKKKLHRLTSLARCLIEQRRKHLNTITNNPKIK